MIKTLSFKFLDEEKYSPIIVELRISSMWRDLIAAPGKKVEFFSRDGMNWINLSNSKPVARNQEEFNWLRELYLKNLMNAIADKILKKKP